MAARPLLFEYFCDRTLEVYLLGRTAWVEVLALQQRLVYELGGEPRNRAALILCEHPPVITIGRQGSRGHILAEEEELRSRQVDVHWTNRGGGCWLQLPGQIAAYAIVPLDPPVVGLGEYRSALYETISKVLDDFDLVAQYDPSTPGVRVGKREIAGLGVAVKDWIAYHGCWLNVGVPPDVFDLVQMNPRSHRKMTCMFRELRTPVRLNAVRASFLRHFTEVFGFADSYVFHAPPTYFVKQDTVHVAAGNH